MQYALNLAKEFKKSVRIVSEALPAWDVVDRLVGDVLILEPDLSCQFFLIVCRCLESGRTRPTDALATACYRSGRNCYSRGTSMLDITGFGIRMISRNYLKPVARKKYLLLILSAATW